MTTAQDFITRCDEGTSVSLITSDPRNGAQEFTFRIQWTEAAAEQDAKVRVSWLVPAVGFQYLWSPLHRLSRIIPPDWGADDNSMISKNAPVMALFDGKGDSRYLWQLSECSKTVFFHSGIMEENGNVECRFTIGTKQFTNQCETTVTLRIDENIQPLYTALQNASKWWEADCGMTPAFVPEDAKLPCYSFWYSFHQEVYAKAVEDECRRAKALGFSTCIIDDGWQTSDNSRGYAFCGDWQPAPEKIPDMKAHVKAVHDIGMKYILWYSVPLIGLSSENYRKFASMTLNPSMRRLSAETLDPRYREVREFLIGIYVKALQDWDLDGFKLDFIDCWQYTPENKPYNPNMDIPSLENAVTVFMNDLIAALKALKPDILLEFRQGYIGPVMRTFGNMFRVGDCPDDYISNRVGIFDLRMLMGTSAVHSDMLMWHKDEKPEIAALQFISVLFSVVQYSARLDSLTPEMQKMSVFYLSFLRKFAHLLQGDSLKVYDPHLLYSWAQVTDTNTCIAAVYAPETVIHPEMRGTTFICNGAESTRVLLDIDGDYSVTVYNCLGEPVSEFDIRTIGLTSIPAPVGGLLHFEKR